ncbi:hypothetical protein F4775DRAFT_521743 [Biscogniauxia sp. FL1348]|nr:hypothetical protein F4775DRAFT_521743 [Biscogniauxia sp. FL1348]
MATSQIASDSDAGAGAGTSFGLASSSAIPQAMQNIGKHKAKRTSIQRSITQDHSARLSALRRRIETYYQREAQKTASLSSQRLARLIAALERRQACEAEIARVAGALREDCAHVAMLLGALYEGRRGMAMAMAMAEEEEEGEEEGGGAKKTGTGMGTEMGKRGGSSNSGAGK